VRRLLRPESGTADRFEILIPALLALVLRLLCLGAVEPFSSLQLSSDEREYLMLAGARFPSAVTESTGPAVPSMGSSPAEPTRSIDLRVTRPPLYPLFLRLSGSGRTSLCLQAVCGALTAALAAWVAGRMGPGRAGLVAGLLVALDPVSILYSALYLSETLFTLLLIGAIAWQLSLADHHSAVPTGSSWISGSTRSSLLAGLAFGLVPLCRPVGLLAGPVFCPRGRRAVPYLVAWIIPLLLWTGSVHFRMAQPPLKHLAVRTLVFYRAAPVLARAEGIDPLEARTRLGFPDHTSVSQAFGVLASHPGTTLAEMASGFARTAFGSGWGTLQSRSWSDPVPARPWAIGLVAALWCLTGYIMAARGIALRRGRPNRLGAGLLILAIAFFLVPAGSEGYSRFRVPIWPLVALLAAAPSPLPGAPKQIQE
jgi:hypothetical protein